MCFVLQILHLERLVVKMVSVQKCSESTGHAEAVQIIIIMIYRRSS